MPLFFCERCGRYFTPTGTTVRRSITARGTFQEPEDSVCPSCLKHNETRVGSDVVVNVGSEDERHFTH